MADTKLTGLAATAAATADLLYIVDNVATSAVSKKATLSQVVNLADHDALTNFVGNEHIDHSGVIISAGEGLAGGGTIAATRALDVDITNATDKAAPVVGDELMLGDSAAAGAIKKSDIAAIVNLADHDQTTNFVANEHIDHTSVNISAGAGLTGGGSIAATRALDVGAGAGVSAGNDEISLTTTSVSATTSADSQSTFYTFEGGALKTIATSALARAVYKEPPTLFQITADLTLTDAHMGGVVEMASAAALVVTVPTSFPSTDVGTHIGVVQTGAGQVTFTAASGMTIQKPATFEAKTKQQWSRADMYLQDKTAAAHVVVLSGHLSAA